MLIAMLPNCPATRKRVAAVYTVVDGRVTAVRGFNTIAEAAAAAGV